MNLQNKELKTSRLSGYIYGILAFGAWGILPIYWKSLKAVPAYEILAHRILWSFIFVSILLTITQSWSKLGAALRDKKSLRLIVLCSVFIAVNWFVYIWAVNANHIVETSMGYYINPLMSVLLGVLVLKERLNQLQYAALGLAFTGVICMALGYGQIPWIALALAISFALYGLCKKMVKAEAALGLALETFFLVPPAFAFIIFGKLQGTGSFASGNLTETLLLMGAGIATATPLLWFAEGTRRVELSTIGFLQYLSPSITLLLGILVYHEEFNHIHMVSFGLIWAGLILFTISKASEFKSIRIAEKS